MNPERGLPIPRRDVVLHVPNISKPNEQSLGRAEAGPSGDTLANPREIEVHIEELVLHGFDPRARWQVGDALESELRELLAGKGLPLAWRSNCDRADAGQIAAVRLTNPTTAGKQIATAIHRGGKK